MKTFYTYIVKCANSAYYVGSTRNLSNRIKKHNEGQGANYTKKHRPIKLVYFEEYKNRKEAEKREKQIKGWSRSKKDNLIEGIWKKA